MEDISEIKRIIRERDKALLDLEKIEGELEEEKVLNNAFPYFVGDSKEINYVKN